MLSREQTKRYYDRFARKQDEQAFYEDPALGRLIERAQLGSAERVFELGSGTGRLAERLLSRHLSEHASYQGIDLSTTMVALAQARLTPFCHRAQVSLTDGSPLWPLASASVDRVISSYVLDLLPDGEIQAVLNEAARVLEPGGRLCVASLTYGVTPLSRLNMWRWQLLYCLNPHWVGGCRPLRLQGRLDSSVWKLRHHEIVVAFGVPSEVIVAEKHILKPFACRSYLS